MARLLVVDSITEVHKLPDGGRGAVVATGSHGGVYAAWVAACEGAAAVVFNDAGGGLDDAGRAGLDWLERRHLPACTVAHTSARIGWGADVPATGEISAVNRSAAALGCRVGQPAAQALQGLVERCGAPREVAEPGDDAPHEARHLLREAGPQGPAIWALDSASLVLPSDAGAIVITGSHGGLLGGRPETAIRAAVRAAVYHDAGVGLHGAGQSRLAALAQRGIAGATVDGATARIGDALSLWHTGRLSAVNAPARRCGAAEGMTVPEFAAALSSALPPPLA